MTQRLERNSGALQTLKNVAENQGKVVIDRTAYNLGRVKPTDAVNWAIKEVVDTAPARPAIENGSLKIVIHGDGEVGEIYKR